MRSGPLRAALPLSAAAVTIVLAATAAPATAAPPEPDLLAPPTAIERDAAGDPEPVVTTDSDEAADKIHPDLAEALETAAPTKPLDFVARVVVGTDLSEYADRWFTRPFADPMGSTVAVGVARPAGIEKIAELPTVISVQLPESIVDPPAPPDPDVEGALRDSVTASVAEADAEPAPEPLGWYHTGTAIHRSSEAWDLGYTGEGVRYMSNDSGADYCHPDLEGTWQYVTDEDSPYYGLPQMFDGYSSYLAARDLQLGEDNIAAGGTDYADTSFVVTRGGPPPPVGPVGRFQAEFQPIGAAQAHAYTLPVTSQSGEYHLGSHPDKVPASVADVLSAAFGDGTAVVGERAAVLVTDENEAGVYDTVYADLNFDFEFSAEERASLTRDFSYQETTCLDYTGDGLNDISGGLVYWVADGVNPVPTHDWYWGVQGAALETWNESYGAGDLVAFHVMDFLEGGGDHGMGTTSVANGQGVVTGSTAFPDGPPQAEGQGLVVGPGRDMRSTQNGNFYINPFIEDGFVFSSLGYDGISGTGDDVQIQSNSWGSSDVDNDGWDYESRLLDSIARAFGPNTAQLFSTGNGAAGYGTASPPSPPSGIGVGASTLFDTVGTFESVASADQVVGGDVMSWSNRGPGALNVSGVDIMATGAFGTGSEPLNAVLDGSIATLSFGGTSMAAPVAAGNLALIYQAFREANDRWPTFEEARDLLMSTAEHRDHDGWTQGAGLVDAAEGVRAAAAGGAAALSPADWSVGDYRGEDYEGFANIVSPGESDTQQFTVTNTGDEPMRVRLRSNRYRLIGTEDYSFTSLGNEVDHGQVGTPDYVRRIDPDIPPGTDLMQVQMARPYEQFDPDGVPEAASAEPITQFNNWRVHLQNWTDLDEDGEFWVDSDGDGKVSIDQDASGAVVGSEMDDNEHVRFSYGYNVGPTQQVRVANPLERMDDGLLLTFRHNTEIDEVPVTDLQVEAEFWRRASWSWLSLDTRRVTVPPGGSATFEATVEVPEDAAPGMYQGQILVDDGSREGSIPVTVAVAAEGTEFALGGQGTVPRNQRALYDNSRMFGYTDYNWRAESGDWRFYWTDVPDGSLPAEGQNLLIVDNSWQFDGTDIDTQVLGPTDDVFSPSAIWGPYGLERQGGSPNAYLGGGRWGYQTSSGGSRELVAAPVQEGLHGIFLHQVKVDGSDVAEEFGGQTGLANLTPGTVAASGVAGSASVTLSSEVPFEGMTTRGFGLSRPTTERLTAQQDDPDDPLSSSVVETVELSNAALLEVTTSNLASGSDLDLYLYGPDGEVVGSSTSPTGEETVSVLFPEDGTYTIRVQGWSVPQGTDQFDLTVRAVQGTGLTAEAPASVEAGSPAEVTIGWDTEGLEPGEYEGLVVVGPEAASGLFQIPVTVTVE